MSSQSHKKLKNILQFCRASGKRWAIYLFFAVIVLGSAIALWLHQLDQEITERLTQGRFAPAIEFYARPEVLRVGYKFPLRNLKDNWLRRHWRQRDLNLTYDPAPGEFMLGQGDICKSLIGTSTDEKAESPPPPLLHCVRFQNQAHASRPGVQYIIYAEDQESIVHTSDTFVELEPELFAQYSGDSPLLREEVPLSNVPVECLNALLAIEDAQFLEHGGVSPTAVLRAALAFIRHGRITQGGSTLTQQTVKNFFLSEERTLRRKIKEMAMSFLIEGRLDKDKILEIYINTIYMGQNAVFQVRGFGAASRHYFASELEDLNLPQCALMAAIVNGPGIFDPFRKPDKALKRRNRVLDRMLELHYIDSSQHTRAIATPLPKEVRRPMTEPAPYFVQSVRSELDKKGVSSHEGLRVYTTLDMRAQEAAYQAVNQGLARLETNNDKIKTQAEKNNKHLEAVLIAADNQSGDIVALVGGRGFNKSPFNRAFDSHRQVGSIMKPFVYLTALEKMTEDGKPYTPLTLLSDQEFTHKFQNQKWSPHNYDNKFHGDVPLYYALKESLNVATGALALKIGLTDIIDTAQRLGISSPIQPFPSLALGAFEIRPYEVLQAYVSLARFGDRVPLRLITKVEDLAGQTLLENKVEPERVVSADSTATLVGIMKQTILNGTAKGALAQGFTHPAAGKTGTTNDKKDAWFSGFTPYHTAVVWVGYDDNTSHELTGASGAVPIWTQYMKNFVSKYEPADDFKWPEGTTVQQVTPALMPNPNMGVHEGLEDPATAPTLVFKTKDWEDLVNSTQAEQ